jgi:predicted nucleotidyltransferase
MSSKEGYVKTSIPLINSLFKYRFFIIITNWIFQGMLYADKTERSFRLLIDLILIFLLFPVISYLISNLYIVFVLSFFIAHTINWVFNGQLFVLGRYLGIKPNKQNEFLDYLNELKIRVERESSIQFVAAYGSMSREELSDTSDLDVRIIRKDGVINGIRACLFGFKERSKALFNRFPLDLYVIDSKNQLSKMRSDEEPIIIYNTQI